MIVLDSSAAIAALFNEPQCQSVTETLSAERHIIMSAANLLECVLRLARGPGPDRSVEIDELIETFGVTVTPIDLEQLHFARAGFLAYGKGRHPAGLNFGDCFAYALAKSRNAPLLFVGEDFAKTDVKRIG